MHNPSLCLAQRVKPNLMKRERREVGIVKGPHKPKFCKTLCDAPGINLVWETYAQAP